MAKKLLNDDKLISLVQARNVIYDKTDRFYTSKTHVRDAWKEIAIEMDSTVVACQKRWRYLRDYFVRQLHMLPDHSLTSINAYANGNGKKKTLWSLFNSLKFLAPFSSTRRGRCKMEDVEYSADYSNSQIDELNCANSLSSTSSAQHSYDLNYLQLLQYQQQLGDYIRSAERNCDTKTLSEGSDYQLVVDLDEFSDDEDHEAKFQQDEEDNGPVQMQQNDDEEEIEIPPTQSIISSLGDRLSTCSSSKRAVIPPTQSIASSLEDRASTCSSSKRAIKRRRSLNYEELIDILRDKRVKVEYDEHEHFFKSLLASVRKIDEEHVISFRTEVMSLVSKYLYMSHGENENRERDDNSDVVLIETDQLHWRRNLRKYQL